jgi:hypothetical protein
MFLADAGVCAGFFYAGLVVGLAVGSTMEKNVKNS